MEQSAGFAPTRRPAAVSYTHLDVYKRQIKNSLYSIRWRIVVAYLLIICVAFTLVATSLIQLVGEYLFSQKVREEQRVTEDLAGSMAQPLSSRDAQALYAQAASVAGQSGDVYKRQLPMWKDAFISACPIPSIAGPITWKSG